MEKQAGPDNSHKDAQAAAMLAGATIVCGFALYWVIQVQAVREMLALAYGS